MIWILCYEVAGSVRLLLDEFGGGVRPLSRPHRGRGEDARQLSVHKEDTSSYLPSSLPTTELPRSIGKIAIASYPCPSRFLSACITPNRSMRSLAAGFEGQLLHV